VQRGLRRAPPGGHRRLARRITREADPPAFARLAELRVPAVVVLGDREYPMVDHCARTIADRLPGCELITVPGADHMLPLRAPELIADLISSRAS
jgi:3-oxoadipate enol-lactonase